jgi:hypothetical protein
LILAIQLEESGYDPEIVNSLASRYAAFTNGAYNEATGRFRNFMSFDRRWLEEGGSEDAQGRALWAVGTCVGRSRRSGLVAWALGLFPRALRACESTESPRTWAFAILGIHEYLRRYSGDRHALELSQSFTDRLLRLYQDNAKDSWPWFEAEAQGLQRLIKEFGLTHEAAAQAVGRSRSAGSNLLRLLNLAEPVQTMLMAGDLDMGHARALLSLDKAAQITAANQIAAKKLSVREAESLAKKLGAEFNLVAQKPKKEKSRDVRRVEEELSDLLMAEVEVRVKKRVKRQGKLEEMGELSIQFGSIDELNGLIEKLRR